MTNTGPHGDASPQQREQQAIIEASAEVLGAITRMMDGQKPRDIEECRAIAEQQRFDGFRRFGHAHFTDMDDYLIGHLDAVLGAWGEVTTARSMAAYIAEIELACGAIDDAFAVLHAGGHL